MKGTARAYRSALRRRDDSLARRSDSVQAWTVVAVAAFLVLLAPIAAYVGYAVFHGQSDASASQQATRHRITAVTLSDASTSGPVSPGATSGAFAISVAGVSDATWADAGWTWQGRSHHAQISVPANEKAGSHVPVWVDEAGNKVAPPTTSTDSLVAGLVAAFGTWFVGALCALAAGALVVYRLNVRRQRDWDLALRELLPGQLR